MENFDVEERVKELTDFISNLDTAIENAPYKYYIERVEDIKEEAQTELEGLQLALKHEQEKEQRALESEYIRSVI